MSFKLQELTIVIKCKLKHVVDVSKWKQKQGRSLFINGRTCVTMGIIMKFLQFCLKMP